MPKPLFRRGMRERATQIPDNNHFLFVTPILYLAKMILWAVDTALQTQKKQALKAIAHRSDGSRSLYGHCRKY